MTKEEIQTRLEAAEKQVLGLLDEIKNLESKLDEVQEDEIPDCPVFRREQQYHINGVLKVQEGNDCYDRICDDDFNVFHTKEYAQLFSDKCREIAMLLHCKWYVDRDFVPNWDDDEEVKFSVNYSHSQKSYFIEDWFSEENGKVFFSSEESALKAAAWMNAHAKRGDSNDD